MTGYVNPGAGRDDFRATAGGRDLRASFTSIGEREYRHLIVLEDRGTPDRRGAAAQSWPRSADSPPASHEIRNPLGAISHASQLLDESPQLRHPTAG